MKPFNDPVFVLSLALVLLMLFAFGTAILGLICGANFECFQ
jgi:VIT1/CCC1 family predicted Fe2+/Mn2+ transporter